MAKQPFDPLDFSQLMVSTYNKEYTGTSNYTLSLTDLNAITPLVENVNAVSQILSSQLRGKNGTVLKNVIKKCLSTNACPSFDKSIYIDLCQFYKNLLKSVDSLKLAKSVFHQFKQMLIAGIALFPKIIKANVTSKNYRQQPAGLSIYFGKHSVDPSYYGLYWTERNPNWLNLLEAYVEG